MASCSERLCFSDRAYFARNGEAILIGHADRPEAVWQVSSGTAVVFSSLWAPTSVDELLTRTSANSAARLGEVLDEMVAADVLVRADDVPPSGAGRTPHQELASLVRPYKDIERYEPQFYHDVWPAVRDFTLASLPLTLTLHRGVQHVLHNRIRGDFVECGVGAGGSAMAIALSCRLLGRGQDRDLWLYDTFNWAWEPAGSRDEYAREPDTRVAGVEPLSVDHSAEAVTRRVVDSGFERDRVRTVKGLVQDTLPSERPSRIAVLRLDTDFYESTATELENLYPLVTEGGVVISDDYGKHAGATAAVDEFLSGLREKPFVQRVASQGAVWLKE